jgi:tRNA (guanine37-N1)-methyltransferase
LTGLAGDAALIRGAGKRVVLLSPQGRPLTQELAAGLAEAAQVVVVCGRYEGVDERVAEVLATDEVSVGDYVLSGGEPAAVVLVDAVTRLVPGALGSETSAVNESFSEGLLDFPNYTRPVEFRGRRVPEVLTGGHHAEVARWRRRAALRKTLRNRPDLFARAPLGDEERASAAADEGDEG